MTAYTVSTGKWYDHAYYVKTLKELPANIEKQARNSSQLRGNTYCARGTSNAD
jgi:hypothetical protein